MGNTQGSIPGNSRKGAASGLMTGTSTAGGRLRAAAPGAWASSGERTGSGAARGEPPGAVAAAEAIEMTSGALQGRL